MTGVYRSAKNHQFISIMDMHTEHILNAIKKVRSGTHYYYHQEDGVLIALLLELEGRNQRQLAELRGTVELLSDLRLQAARKGVASRPVATQAYTRNLLNDLRNIALTVVREKGLVTADTLREAYRRSHRFLNLPTSEIGGILPYVFRDRRFKKIGFLRSTFGPNNGRFINVWGASAAL